MCVITFLPFFPCTFLTFQICFSLFDRNSEAWRETSETTETDETITRQACPKLKPKLSF